MSFTISRRALAGVATGAVAASAVSTIAAAKTAEEIMKDGTLRIGVHPNSPPFSWRDQAGAWSGFDVTIGQRIAEDLKLKAELVPTETAERIDFLNAGKIDISLGGLTRRPSGVIFSRAWLPSCPAQ